MSSAVMDYDDALRERKPVGVEVGRVGVDDDRLEVQRPVGEGIGHAAGGRGNRPRRR
jgi:hypothetical protein